MGKYQFRLLRGRYGEVVGKTATGKKIIGRYMPNDVIETDRDLSKLDPSGLKFQRLPFKDGIASKPRTAGEMLNKELPEDDEDTKDREAPLSPEAKELMGKTINELKVLAKEMGVELDSGKKERIVELILEQASQSV